MGWKNLKFSKLSQTQVWYTVGKLVFWGFWKHVIQYVFDFVSFCQFIRGVRGGWKNLKFSKLSQTQVWYTVGKLEFWGFWKHVIQYVYNFVIFCQFIRGGVKKFKVFKIVRLKCDTLLESWSSEVSENMLCSMFSIL